MKRNRKAEARKQLRHEAEQSQVAGMLDQMQAAAQQILVERFGSTREEVWAFFDRQQTHFQAKPPKFPLFSTKQQRLTITAQSFGLAGLKALKELGFTAEQLDTWLKDMIAYQQEAQRAGQEVSQHQAATRV